MRLYQRMIMGRTIENWKDSMNGPLLYWIEPKSSPLFSFFFFLLLFLFSISFCRDCLEGMTRMKIVIVGRVIFAIPNDIPHESRALLSPGNPQKGARYIENSRTYITQSIFNILRDASFYKSF